MDSNDSIFISNSCKGTGRLVGQTIKKQLFQGVRVGNNGVMVNLFQFTDDTLFIYERLILKISW